jgi:hypothetical protein
MSGLEGRRLPRLGALGPVLARWMERLQRAGASRPLHGGV